MIARKEIILAFGSCLLFSIFSGDKACAEDGALQAPHVLLPAPAPFHFSDEAMERDRVRLTNRIATALAAYRQSSRVADSALWQARDADLGSPEWLRAREAVQQSVRDFAPVREAILTYIAFLDRAAQNAPPNENHYAIDFRDVAQDDLAGYYQWLTLRLARLARMNVGE
jgi:hypothetical protein